MKRLIITNLNATINEKLQLIGEQIVVEVKDYLIEDKKIAIKIITKRIDIERD